MSSDVLLRDQGSNVANDCKKFYERRLVMTESAAMKWRQAETDIAFGTIRRNKAGTLVRTRSQDEDNEPFVRLPLKIAQLRREILSLADVDNELFKNLLTLNDKIEDLKRSHRSKVPHELEKIDMKPIVNGVDYHSETLKEESEWPLSFEDAQVFASLPVSSFNNNNYTKTLPNSSRRRKVTEQTEETKGPMKFVLRSKSFLLRQPFQRKQVSSSNNNKLSKKKTLEEELGQMTLSRKSLSPQDVQAPFSSLQMNGSSGHVTRPPVNQPLFHMPPSRFLWQKMFFSSSGCHGGPESLPNPWIHDDDGGFASRVPLSRNHVKQSSFDSGIHRSDSEHSIKV